MSDPKLDLQLKQFLEDMSREKARGMTNANIMVKLNQMDETIHEYSARVEHMETRVDRHGREIKAIKRQIEYEGEIDTGSHPVDDIRREVERQRMEHDAERKAKQEEVVWWKRQIVVWIVAAVGVIVLQALTLLISRGLK